MPPNLAFFGLKAKCHVVEDSLKLGYVAKDGFELIFCFSLPSTGIIIRAAAGRCYRGSAGFRFLRTLLEVLSVLLITPQKSLLVCLV